MVWLVGPDGYSGATALSVPATTKNSDAVTLLENVSQFDYSWLNLASGWIPGSIGCLLYTSPSPRDGLLSRMPSSA